MSTAEHVPAPARACVQEGEQTMTQIMGHPPGGEGDPDDRAMHVPPEGFEEDADGNVVQNVGGPVEGQPQPPPDGAGWSQEQLQVRAEAPCDASPGIAGYSAGTGLGDLACIVLWSKLVVRYA